MQVFTLEHLIKIERVASRAVNASKAFAEGQDRQLLEDLTTLISEIRHAASCTREGQVSIADLWVAQEARTDAVDAALGREAVRQQDAKEQALECAIDAAFQAWSRGEGEAKGASYWGKVYDVWPDHVSHGLTQRIKAEHLDRQLVRTDN